MSATAVAPVAERLTPIERLEVLCDPGSVHVLRSRVTSPRLGARAVAGDGVVGATGTVAGRPIVCYAQDGAYLGGSLGERHAETIIRVLELAGRGRIPVVAFVESGGRADAGGGSGARRLRAHLPPDGLADRRRAADLDRVRRLSRWRCVFAGAHRPDRDDPGRRDVSDRPGIVREALGEEIDAISLGGPQGPRPQRCLPAGRGGRPQRCAARP